MSVTSASGAAFIEIIATVQGVRRYGSDPNGSEVEHVEVVEFEFNGQRYPCGGIDLIAAITEYAENNADLTPS